MDKLTTLLAVVAPGQHPDLVMSKALALARAFGARIELFLCDAEHAYILDRAYDREGIERARELCRQEGLRFLEHVQRTAAASDVPVSLDVACHSPLYEGVVEKTRQCRADLILKAPTGEHPMRRFSLGPNDWQLARTCPATLMLVRGRPWRTTPRLAAAVDVSDEDTSRLGREIMRTTAYLATGCHAELEMLYCEPPGTDEHEQRIRRRRLDGFAKEFHIDAGRIHIIEGEPETMLPAFAAARRYDALIMGALTHRPGLTAMLGTLTSRLVEQLECDFVLVKRSTPESGKDTPAAPHDPASR